MKKHTVIILFGIILVLNAVAWFFMSQSRETTSPDSYPLLSPRIFAEKQNDILIKFVPLRKQIEARFNGLPEGTQYSFYFEYLPSGTSIRVGDDNELIAASLIKLPLVMNLYRSAELGKINLDDTVTITESELDGGYGDLWKKGAGAQYTLRQLAQMALEQSDNTAAHAIFDHTTNLLNEENQSLAQLDVDENTNNGQAVINAKSYTSVLKSLYFASYNNRDNSNEILSYLTKSAETRRLTKSLPRDIKVAHKNGVYNQTWAESDCGIVYVPKRPYAICIMVGLPEDTANEFMADISRLVYDYIVTQ